MSVEDVALSEGVSGTTTFTFTISRTHNKGDVSVNYATVDGTATTADGDFVADSGTVNFTAGGALTQTITIQVNGDGLVAPATGVYQHNETLQLTATAHAGSIFVGWSGDLDSTQNPLDLNISSDLEVVANFVIDVAGNGNHALFLPLIMR